MKRLKPATKSLIIALLIIFINFGAYLSFRFFVSQEVNILEGLKFTAYDTILELVIITPISFIFFKRGMVR